MKKGKNIIGKVVAVVFVVLMIGNLPGIAASNGEPTLCYSPPNISFPRATEGGSNPSSQMLRIWNCGEGVLEWSVSDDAAWLSLSPDSGSMSAGETTNVIVSADISPPTWKLATTMLSLPSLGVVRIGLLGGGQSHRECW